MAVPLPDRPDASDHVWTWLEDRYREHGAQLYRYALGVLGNREDAEDATQIALLQAYRALAGGARPARPRAWLFAISLNVCRRLLRTRSRRPSVGLREEAASTEPIDGSTGAELRRAVASLPRDQREIFLLRELRGLSYAELGERLGLSADAAESRLARARRRLRAQLAGEAGADTRRGLFGVPGVVMVTLRGLAAPTAAKLAPLVGTAALVPVVVGGLNGDTPAPPLRGALPQVVRHRAPDAARADIGAAAAARPVSASPARASAARPRASSGATRQLRARRDARTAGSPAWSPGPTATPAEAPPGAAAERSGSTSSASRSRRARAETGPPPSRPVRSRPRSNPAARHRPVAPAVAPAHDAVDEAGAEAQGAADATVTTAQQAVGSTVTTAQDAVDGTVTTAANAVGETASTAQQAVDHASNVLPRSANAPPRGKR